MIHTSLSGDREKHREGGQHPHARSKDGLKEREGWTHIFSRDLADPTLTVGMIRGSPGIDRQKQVSSVNELCSEYGTVVCQVKKGSQLDGLAQASERKAERTSQHHDTIRAASHGLDILCVERRARRVVAFDQRLQVGRVSRPRRTSEPEHRNQRDGKGQRPKRRSG